MVNDTPSPLNKANLHAFYGYAVLPQFGIASDDISWQGGTDLGPDESAHFFSLDGVSYVLIFEDAGGLARTDAYIKEKVLVNGQPYEYVRPISEAPNSPSYDGFHPPTPYQYVPNITGTFTLIRLR